jgi:hypothetical protein
MHPRHATLRPILASIACLALPAHALAQVRYVRADLTTGANDGSSWANAFRGSDALNRAITAAVNGDELWVAAGTYRPVNTASPRNGTFTLKPGVALYGGFAGTEQTRSQRNFRTNTTILSGDLSANDATWPSGTGRTENAFNVVTASGASANPGGVLDGFTVQSGQANGPNNSFTGRGGGIVIVSGANPTIRNSRFRFNAGNFGGGAYITGASATFEDCVLELNNGGGFGGGCDMASATATWTRCQFLDNTASRAGGLEVFGSSTVTVDNSLFARNTSTSSSAGNSGGGLWIGPSATATPTVTVRNSTIVANRSPSVSGAGLQVTGSGALAPSVTVRNTIAWGNLGPANATSGQQLTGTLSAQHSLVQGSLAGTGNIASDPQFADSAAGNYRLLPTSPAIDAGSNTAAGTQTIDLDASPRRRDDPRRADTGVGPAPVIDLGAFEHQPVCTPSDVAGPGGVIGPEGELTADDIILFITWFVATDLRADIAGSGQQPTPDAELTADDVILFITRFTAGC